MVLNKRLNKLSDSLIDQLRRAGQLAWLECVLPAQERGIAHSRCCLKAIPILNRLKAVLITIPNSFDQLAKVEVQLPVLGLDRNVER
jgi:hypothetical protein